MSWRQKSFEVLPALSVRGRPLRAALRTITVAWMFGIVWMVFVSGSQMTLFCRMLGFTNRDFGILAAIPFAATLVQLVAAIIIERTGLRKYPFLFYASVNRLLWLAIAAVPLLLKPGRAAIAVFLGVFALANVLTHMSMPFWIAWMGDLIPRRIRGRYFATRTLWTLPIRIVVIIAAGIALDRATVAGAPMTIQAQPALLWTICGLFAVAGIFGVIDALLFFRIREIVSPPLINRPARRPRQGPLAALAGALAEPVRIVAGAFRDRTFRHYALYGATIAFSITVCGQFYWLNALEEIGYSKLGANLVFLGVGVVGAFAVVRPWGKLIDRWGRRPALILATVGVVFVPVVWFFIPPGQMFLAYLLGAVACLLGTVTWTGVNLAQTGIILGFAETAGRSRYVAAAAVAAAVGGFAGGLTGGQIAESLPFLKNPIHVGPFLWNNYHMTFLVSMVARAAAILWLIGMPDPGAKPLREVVRQMRFSAYNNVRTRLFWPVRALGQRLARRNTNRRRNQDQS